MNNQRTTDDLVDRVWNLKVSLEARIGVDIYWSFTLGDNDGRVCTVVTFGLNGHKVQVKAKSREESSFGVVERLEQSFCQQFMISR